VLVIANHRAASLDISEKRVAAERHAEGMDVRDDDVTAGLRHSRQLGDRWPEVLQMCEREPADGEVDGLVANGKRAQVTHQDVEASGLCSPDHRP